MHGKILSGRKDRRKDGRKAEPEGGRKRKQHVSRNPEILKGVYK